LKPDTAFMDTLRQVNFRSAPKRINSDAKQHKT
jgi:hypothetical protein